MGLLEVFENTLPITYPLKYVYFRSWKASFTNNASQLPLKGMVDLKSTKRDVAINQCS